MIQASKCICRKRLTTDDILLVNNIMELISGVRAGQKTIDDLEYETAEHMTKILYTSQILYYHY